jgi:hypothetical protein
MPYQPPLPPNEAPSGVDAAAGVTPVGLRPPFVTPAAAHSHPDCRGIPILIVAPQTFMFLGFIHICGKSRRGNFLLERKTRRDRLRTKL